MMNCSKSRSSSLDCRRDAFTTKAINTVTIVTFGMLFLTVFIESLHDDYEQSANLLLVKVKNMR